MKKFENNNALERGYRTMDRSFFTQEMKHVLKNDPELFSQYRDVITNIDDKAIVICLNRDVQDEYELSECLCNHDLYIEDDEDGNTYLISYRFGLVAGQFTNYCDPLTELLESAKKYGGFMAVSYFSELESKNIIDSVARAYNYNHAMEIAELGA